MRGARSHGGWRWSVAVKQLWLGLRAWRSFRSSFWLGVFADMTWLAFSFVFFGSIYGRVGSIGGWGWSDVVLLIGTAQLIEGAHVGLFESNLRRLSAGVRSGALDRWLLYPVDTQLLLIFGRVNLRGLLVFFLGLGVVLYALRAGEHQIGAASLVRYGLLVVGGVAVRLAAAFLIETLAFFFVDVAVLRALQNEFYGYAAYPQSVYPGWAWKLLFTLLIPVLWMGNVPVAALREPGQVLPWLAFPPLLLLASRLLFAAALRRYQSAGG